MRRDTWIWAIEWYLSEKVWLTSLIPYALNICSRALPWFVTSSLNLPRATTLLPKFKDHFYKFSSNRVPSKNEHLSTFSNACINIDMHNNDTCMCLLFNSIEGRATTEFFKLPDKIFTTWCELTYWFKSTFGSVDNLTEYLKCFNNLDFKESETINDFNLHFMKLYNHILEVIRPSC